MKVTMKSLPATIAVLVLSAAIVPTVRADDGLSAAAGVASSYYWRGLQVSDGAQVWGELTYTLPAGFYGDLWASSEGFGTGPEYDLTAGWTGKFGDLGVNVGAVTYVYSSDRSNNVNQSGHASPYFKDSDPGDFSDVFVKLSYGGAFLNFYHNVALFQGQDWINLGYTYGKWTGSVGYQEFKDKAQVAASGAGNSAGTDIPGKVHYSYVDLTYAVTDHLSMTVSSVVEHSDDIASYTVPAGIDSTRAKVIVAYSLPISF
jgi:hypothetical protein